ncbi:MAG: gluconate 2-dehydrogenase subunit 3 family protein [Gammaproteobacteria bacterium]|nr:gluconate 2-dehydrogenase subunit 3 family protein [Gammaproteobacteria bacterium]
MKKKNNRINGRTNDRNDLFEESPVNPSRRSLLKGVGLVGAAAVSTIATSHVIAADMAGKNGNLNTIAPREALEALTALEAETLAAICDCLIPSDEHGPGAREARAVHYIDKSLASHNSSARHNYSVGLNAINEFARKTRGKSFPELLLDQQNSILLAVQTNKISGFIPNGSGFFNLLRSHTIDGTFCDPYYGGNQDFVGWDMLHYPGIRLGASEADVAAGASLPPNHQSAYDHSTYTKLADNASKDVAGGDGYA